MMPTRWITLLLIPLVAFGMAACSPTEPAGEAGEAAPAAEEAAVDGAAGEAAEAAVDETEDEAAPDTGAAAEEDTMTSTGNLICGGDLSMPEIGDDFEDIGSGVLSKDLVVGEGKLVEAGTQIQAHYAGFLEDGKMFDSSCNRGMTLPVHVGTGGVIKGWDLGLQGMKVGGRRVLVIPPELGYGDGGVPQVGIGPSAVLIFDVEVVSAQ